MTSSAGVAAPPVRPRERGARILHEPRLLLLLLAGGVMATIVVFVVGFSGALFTASSSDGGSTVGAGEIKLALSNSGELVDGAGLKPGVTRSGSVTVTNAGEKATVTLAVSSLTDTPAGGPSLADIVYVKVAELSPQPGTRFNGKLRSLSAATLALGTWAPGEQRRYQIDVSWPPDQDSPTYQNVQTKFGFDWKAASVL